MIINSLLDNDLYKFTTMYAIQKLYPDAFVRYRFIMRERQFFPEPIQQRINEEIKHLTSLRFSEQEILFLRDQCPYFSEDYLNTLKYFRFNKDDISLKWQDGLLSITIEGNWYKTVLWEVPLLAIISELYHQLNGEFPLNLKKIVIQKAYSFEKLNISFSDFGTRRRFSFRVHEEIILQLITHAPNTFLGTSNVYMAMKNNLKPIGTQPHEWIMFHGAKYGYPLANEKSIDAWISVYGDQLGIALTDTYTSDIFFKGVRTDQIKMLQGLRCDSGDPVSFIDKVIIFYQERGINPSDKLIIFSDSLNLQTILNIENHKPNAVKKGYGIGTNLTNDVGHKPLNMVIKVDAVKMNYKAKYKPVIKLSDDPGKNTGDKREIEKCKTALNM